MKNYIFKSTTTMKPYNRNKYWIDEKIIPELRIAAENLKEAVKKFADICTNDYYTPISKNAIKNADPMYIGNGKQIGYVFTGLTEIWNRSDNIAGIKQYINIWVEIIEIDHPIFDGVKI